MAGKGVKQEDKEGMRRPKRAQEARGSKLRGHEEMIVWQNMDRLDIIVQKILKRIPRVEVKMKLQIDNASDSGGANFVEGCYSGSIREYLKFLRYSKRSLGELRERVRRVNRKGYVLNGLYEELNDLAIKRMYLIDRLMRSLENI